MPEILRTAPGVLHRLPGRLAINVKQYRILPGRVECRWLDHPAIEIIRLGAPAATHAEKLEGPARDRRHTSLELPVIHERPHHGVTRQPNEFDDGRRVDRRRAVNREVP